MNSIELLKGYPLTHAGIKPAFNPKLGAGMNGRTVVRYLRFLKPVEIDRLELAPVFKCGRGSPSVPTHPAHIIVSILDQENLRWKVVRDVELEPDPRIRGEGLHQGMRAEELQKHFNRIKENPKQWIIGLNGLKTDLLRVECDREHPVWPNHQEQNGNIFNVPFKTLDSISVFGIPPREAIPRAERFPVLTRGRIAPVAPMGMTARQVGEMILFASDRLSVGFALRRPILLHFGWDAFGSGQAGHNRAATRRVRFGGYNRSVSGPVFVSPYRDFGSHHWTGEVSISGNTISYAGLRTLSGVFLDAVFTVGKDRLLLELIQSANENIPLIEMEAWRFAFSISRGMTAVAGVPSLKPGRSGDVCLPAMFASDSGGGIFCRLLEGDPDKVSLQVESYRSSSEVVAGIVLGRRPEGTECLHAPEGTIRAVLEFKVGELQPDSPVAADKAAPGLRRHWTSSFSCFRPEFGGFSNNAIAVHCHVNQHGPIEVAAFTRSPLSGFKPLDMARFTIGRAVMDGGGYGYWRNLYLDSDPVLVSSAGRIHQRDPDISWLKSIQPGLVQAVDRMLGAIGEEGLALCRDLSGNSGSFRWSCNAWDIVGFGHMDAYVNAWTYRALRNAAALTDDLGEKELSRRCRDGALSIRQNYAEYLLNPETGWVGSWRSRDGQLHDYAFLWINGPACAFGLLNDETAKTALANLEKLRGDLGIASARLGAPFALLPLDPADHMMAMWSENAGILEPTFETFTDGSMAPSAITYYLRALSIYGFKERSSTMAAELDMGFADGAFIGSAGGMAMGEGKEFLSWEGLASGYEGTFGPTFGALYSIAVEQGILLPPDPEWWPANG